MSPDWLRCAALVTVRAAVALLLAPYALAFVGAPAELGVALSSFSFIALIAAAVFVSALTAREPGWAVRLGSVAFAADVVAVMRLLVREPQPAFEHPEWAWYWPAVNPTPR